MQGEEVELNGGVSGDENRRGGGRATAGGEDGVAQGDASALADDGGQATGFGDDVAEVGEGVHGIEGGEGEVGVENLGAELGVDGRVASEVEEDIGE